MTGRLYILSLSWLWDGSIILKDVVMEENWVKGTCDLSASFLTTACEPTIISVKLLIKKLTYGRI